jgi:hypothetical protein
MVWHPIFLRPLPESLYHAFAHGTQHGEFGVEGLNVSGSGDLAGRKQVVQWDVYVFVPMVPVGYVSY